MRQNNMTLETSETNHRGGCNGFASTVLLLLLVGLLLLVMGFAGASFAQESPQQRTFSSPVEASDALFQAAQKQMSRYGSYPRSRKGGYFVTGRRRLSWSASSLVKSTRRCTVWFESPMEARCCTSERKTGLFRSL